MPPPVDPRHEVAPGVFGWLERPRPDEVVRDCLLISGWAFSRGVPIETVFARGLGPDIALSCQLRRDDVASVYAGDPESISSGFSGFVEVEIGPSRLRWLEIWARLADGRTIKLFTWSARRARVRHWLSSRILAPLRRHGPGASSPAATEGGPVRWFERACAVELESFLSSAVVLNCPQSTTPRVSVVIVLWNRAELTLRALRSVCEERDIPVEVVLVDNGSTDRTAEVLERVRGATVVANAENLGFTVGANQGARAARGQLLLFLNSDAVLHPGALQSVTSAIERSSTIGAAGGKLIWPDGRLQEAGAIIWADGSCEGYGRGGNPSAPEYSFERDVDFCSGALLITPRDLFLRLGGFNEQYSPAYYEDVDYCVRLWKEGLRVVYEPRAVATHVEFASSRSLGDGMRLQIERRPMFIRDHQDWLANQPARSEGTLEARSRPRGRPWVLVIDDALPDPKLGAGFPRAAALLRALRKLGWFVIVYPMAPPVGGPNSSTEFRDVEVVQSGGPQGLGPLFKSLAPQIRVVIVSRPHNMRYVKTALGKDLAEAGRPVIYDAEALSSLRDAAERRLNGTPWEAAEVQSLLERETGLARGCAGVLTVSASERRHFLDAGASSVTVLTHAVEISPTPAAYDQRRSLLLVGAFGPGSPNEDAARFLLQEVHPALRSTAAAGAPVVVAGARLPESLRLLGGSGVAFHADVADLTPLYDEARVFVAPTRYSAGIPLKLLEAAARGVPIVCTTRLASQLDWTPGVDLLTADSPDEFARAIGALFSDAALWRRLRESALRRVADEYSSAVFESQLKAALGSV